MIALSAQTNEAEKSTNLREAADENDVAVVHRFIERYGGFVWALAKKFTRSREEAEQETEKIFTDIWQSCGNARDIQSIEKKSIAMIALRRLLKSSSPSKHKSMASLIEVSQQVPGGTGY